MQAPQIDEEKKTLEEKRGIPRDPVFRIVFFLVTIMRPVGGLTRYSARLEQPLDSLAI
jgi:hypothetical protein